MEQKLCPENFTLEPPCAPRPEEHGDLEEPALKIRIVGGEIAYLRFKWARSYFRVLRRYVAHTCMTVQDIIYGAEVRWTALMPSDLPWPHKWVPGVQNSTQESAYGAGSRRIPYVRLKCL